MKAYFDASTFTSLVLGDAGADTLGAWLRSVRPAPYTSDFGWGEFIAATSARARAARQSLEQHAEALAVGERMRAGWTITALSPADIALATTFVRQIDLSLRLPDALHIALAIRIRATLVTADRQQARAGALLGLSTYNPMEP